MLSVRSVSKRYSVSPTAHAVLSNVSMDLGAGSSIALTGESGSGKSTLLHLIAALDHYDSGDITIDGICLTGLSDNARSKLRRTKVALIFQQLK
mgnify:FL=1